VGLEVSGRDVETVDGRKSGMGALSVIKKEEWRKKPEGTMGGIWKRTTPFTRLKGN